MSFFFRCLHLFCLAMLIMVSLSRCSDSPSSPYSGSPKIYTADDGRFQYMGRIDFSDPQLPRYWAPGVAVKARFSGPNCKVLLHDQMLWDESHNYISVKIDDRPAKRLQLSSKSDILDFGKGLSAGEHKISIYKDTEGGIGYLEFVGLEVDSLLEPRPLPERKIEFIGNSITCAFGADTSEIPCDDGTWYDQHNAYNSYGAITARNLDAQYHLTAVSGIGLMHSCCEMEILMPQVYDKICLRGDSVEWDYSQYRPDVVSICLGQNDGVQDSAEFCSAYVGFVERIRSYYPSATIVCVGSPMADETLWPVLENYLNSVVAHFKENREENIASFFFEEQYIGGCGAHPSVSEQKKMGAQLTAFIKSMKGW